MLNLYYNNYGIMLISFYFQVSFSRLVIEVYTFQSQFAFSFLYHAKFG